MVVSCSAYGCTNRHNPDVNISFHTFPLENKELLAKWLHAVRRRGFKPTNSSTLCSMHFLKEDFISRPGKMKPRLRKDAVPSIFPGLPEHLQPKQKISRSRKELVDSVFIAVESLSVQKREVGSQTIEDYSLLKEIAIKLDGNEDGNENSISVTKREIGTQTLEDDLLIHRHQKMSHDLLKNLRKKVKYLQQSQRRGEKNIQNMKQLMEKKGILNSDIKQLLEKYYTYTKKIRRLEAF